MDEDAEELSGNEGEVEEDEGNMEGNGEGPKREAAGGAASPLPPSTTELHNSSILVANYLDTKLDKLFQISEKINTDMTEMEKRIMTLLQDTMQANNDALTSRIIGLEKLASDQGQQIVNGEKKAAQQAHQLDELQNQVGIITFRLH